jgi:hypothetical protein
MSVMANAALSPTIVVRTVAPGCAEIDVLLTVDAAREAA